MTPADITPLHRRLPRSAAVPVARGFTLLEILVAVVIIGVVVSVATLSVSVLGRDREAEEESRRFWTVMQQASEEAELQAMDIAVFVSASGYEYLRFDPRRAQWIPLVGDKLFAQRELPEGLSFRMWLDSREIVLKPQLPDRSDADEHEKWPPQVMVLSSGDVMPFELQIERDRAEALWRVVGMPDNDLRIERREARSAWSLVQQTKEPDEEDESSSRERFSSAR